MYDQFLAVGIMALVYALIVSERVHRTTAVLLGVVLVMGTGLLTVSEAAEFVDWNALGLIFGMFILVAAMTESGFFRWIGLHTLHAARFGPARTFLLLCGLAALLAAFMDSITVMIFMGGLALEACQLLGLRPAPFLIGMIMSANIGGSATMAGDPPNVILGTSLNLGFPDFLVNTGPIALAAFAVTAGYVYLAQRRTGLRADTDRPATALAADGGLDPASAIRDWRLLRVSLVVFAFTVTLLILHQVLDLMVAFIALLGATLVLMLGGKDMPALVTKIDWHTLTFLGGLFVIVGAMEKSGVLESAAAALGGVAAGNLVLLALLLLWSSALLSMFVDSVPLAAAMVPIIRGLASQAGVPVAAFAWPVALGTDVGGSGTPIGSSPNVVGLAVAEKAGVHVSWREYLGIALPATLLGLVVCSLFLVLRAL